MRAAVGLIALLLPLAWPAAAGAGTVSLEHGDFFGVLHFKAAQGEANDVTVSGPDGDGAIAVVDSGAALAVGDGCASVGPNEASCAVPGWMELVDATVRTGDGDDRIAVDLCGAGRVELRGGAGADSLLSRVDGARLFGGRGPDVMSAEAGLCDAGTGGLVHYGERTRAVFASLDGRANDGEAGEGDSIGPGIRWVVGGRAGDVLRGSSGDDRLVGGGGPDRIAGMGGDDALRGGSGDDLLRGGPGRDVLAGELGADVLRGEDGADVLEGGAQDDVLRGGGGSDFLLPGNGRDRAEGGAGGDSFLLRDAKPDVAFGGGGRDLAHADPRLDRVVGIERVCARLC